jgi:hypothetical protein
MTKQPTNGQAKSKARDALNCKKVKALSNIKGVKAGTTGKVQGDRTTPSGFKRYRIKWDNGKTNEVPGSKIDCA